MFNEYDCILTAEEVSEMLKVGINRIYKLLNEGSIKGYREGRRWRITKQAIIEYAMFRSNL